MKKLKSTIIKAKEPFIYSYLEHYIEEIPPLWITAEVLSFGDLSVWYKKLKNIEVQEKISNVYNINPTILKSWLHHLTYIRNCCAHHSRVWNKAFTITPKIPENHLIEKYMISLENEKSSEQNNTIYLENILPLKNERRIYNTIIIIDYLWDKICLNCKTPWRYQVRDLIIEYNIDSKRMGFPETWLNSTFWQ